MAGVYKCERPLNSSYCS